MTGRVAIRLLVFLGFTGPLPAASCLLEPGKPVQVSPCSLQVKAGDYIRVIVETNFVKLSAKLVSPDGAAAAAADNQRVVNSLEEDQPLPLAAIAAEAGVWQVEIAAPPSPPKRFSVRLDEFRPARPEDDRRLSADRAFLAGLQKRMERNSAAYRAAVVEFSNALAIRDELGDRAPRGPLLDQLGDMHARVGDVSRAMAFYEQARDAYRESGNAGGEAGALASIGQVHFMQGNLPQAFELLPQAVPVFQRLGMRRHEAATLEALATVCRFLGDPLQALEYHQTSLQLMREEGDRRDEAVSLANIGIVYITLGDPGKAIASYRQALAIEREIGDRPNEMRCLINIGDVYRKLGEFDKALASYEEALQLSRGSGVDSLRGIGEIYFDRGEPAKALTYFEKVLAVQRKSDPIGIASTLNLMGGCWVALRDPGKALRLHEEALETLRSTQSRYAQQLTLRHIGEALFRLDRLGEALQRTGEALEMARAIQAAEDEERLLFQRAQILRAQGRLPEARADLEASLRIGESIRGRVAAHESRASYLATLYDRYSVLTDLLMQMGLHREAFETAERARARGLLDLLAEARAGIRQGVDIELLARERKLAARLEAASTRQARLLGGQAASAKATAIEDDIRKWSDEYQDVENEIRRASPRYAALAYPQPFNLGQIRNQVLDSETVLLEYALAEPRSYVWAITPDSLTAATLPGRAAIEAAVRKFYDRAGTRQPLPSAETDELSRMLLGPVAAVLSRRRVAIVADGALAYLPFGALRTPGAGSALLLAGHEVVMIPSAATLAVLRTQVASRPAAPKLAAVFADPVFSSADPRVGNASPTVLVEEAALGRSASESGLSSLDRLPATRREARSILGLARGRSTLEAVDFRASRTAALDPGLAQYRIVHFATHGLINSRHPELSGLVLSLVDPKGRPQDGFLQARDIYNMTLRADLVVLSACRTALGKEIRGEGLVGLTRAFMYAGAPRIVASLWQVPDRATADLMARFYRGLLSEDLAPASALRQAQLELARDPRYRDPYYWAGFVFQGEWR